MRVLIIVAIALQIVTGPAVAMTRPVETPSGDPRVVVRDAYALGETPDLKAEGLQPAETVGFHLFRQLTRWLPDGAGGWRAEPTLMHGWALFTADDAGRVSAASAVPLDGSSLATGPRTLFWSARRSGDPELSTQAFAEQGVVLDSETTLLLRVTRGQQVIAEKSFGIDRTRASMTKVDIVTPELVGVFAAPAGATSLPTIIHLHGSEGGSLAKSRDISQRYAEAGFATLAVAYFAWPHEIGDLPLPVEHRNVPIELLDHARTWLAGRSEADVNRIALVGNSKGAEFAMVGAVYHPWVRAAVGCVPSDVVWEGYGHAEAPGQAVTPAAGDFSSWSWQGLPLPFIPTWGDRRDGFIDNTDRYDQARAEFGDAARASRIPIERTQARLFLIGGDRDRTWSSGAMVRSLANAMDAVDRGGQVETLISPTGGHYLCGDGLYPHRLWQVDDPSAFAPDLDRQGRDEAAAWEAKLAFLHGAIGGSSLEIDR